jgi:hypothetical protein
MFEAYKVAVKLTLVNGVSSGLAGLALQFQNLNKHVGTAQSSITQLERKLMEIKGLGLVGGAMAGAGAFGLSLFSAPLEEAKKFQQESAKFASLGFGEAVNRQAVQFATGMKTIGTSARDNMAIVGDAMAVFKDMNEAKMVAPLMAKMKFANEVIFGADAGGDRDRKLMDMMKVVEFRGGLKSPEEFARQANFAQQAIAGSRNRVDSSAMLQALKTGGVALSRRSNEAFYLGAEPLIQEFGGSRYGTAAMSIYQNLVQSRGTITAQQELYRLGLLNKDMVQFNQLGKLKKALPGAFTGSGILEQQGELALLEKVLLPAFAKQGITSEEGVLRELGMILGNRTGAALMSRIYQQREKLHIQTAANMHAENLDQASARASGTYEGKLVDMHAKWRTLMKELGDTILPVAIKATQGLIGVLKGAIDFAREFTLLTKGMLIAFGVLAGIVAAGGVVMLATASFKALGLAMAFNAAGGFAGIAGVTTAIKGMSLAFGMLTKASGVFMAAYAGWKAGGLINDYVLDPLARKVTGNKNDTFGTALFDIFGTKTDLYGNVVQPGASNKGGKHGDVYLDGRKVGKVLSESQAKTAARSAFNGVSFFDSGMNLAPVGH